MKLNGDKLDERNKALLKMLVENPSLNFTQAREWSLKEYESGISTDNFYTIKRESRMAKAEHKPEAKKRHTKKPSSPKLFLASTSLRAQERKLLDSLLELLGYDCELSIEREGEAVVGFIRIGGITAPLDGVFK